MSKAGKRRKFEQVVEPEVEAPDPSVPEAPIAPAVVERILRSWQPPGFTRAAFRTMVGAFQLGAPWSMDDLVEVKTQLQENLPAGYALDVVLRPAGYVYERNAPPLKQPTFEVSVFGDERLATEWIAVP